jgi:leader peptidase (prepilin peptidase)/N-methyltransferase
MGVGLVAVVMWTAALSVYDIRHRRLPNSLTLPGAAVILLESFVAGRGPSALAGAAALAGIYLAVHAVAPAAMGAGDVKLAIGLGALTGCFGVDVWLLGALGAPVFTALWAIVAVLRRSGPTVPHGPSMCAATLAATALAVF